MPTICPQTISFEFGVAFFVELFDRSFNRFTVVQSEKLDEQAFQELICFFI